MSIRGTTGRFIEWEEAADGKMYMYAQVSDLPASTAVEPGTGGIVQWNNDGSPVFQMETAIARDPTQGQLPAVAAEGGVKGDTIRVQVYGEAVATFITAFDTRTHKNIRKSTGAPMEALATVADNVLWGTVVGAGAQSRTQTVFLDGSPTWS